MGLLDIKPWDDETDMDKMLECAKTIEKDGLVWGAHKLVPVGYGIKKLQLMCVVEDEKVSIDELCEQIQEFEDYVQSVDISRCAWWKMKRSPSTSCASRSRSSRTMSSQSTSAQCPRFKNRQNLRSLFGAG